jgi:aminopeptidase YwaD
MKELMDVVKSELSGPKAKACVAELTRFHRIQGSSMMDEAARHVSAELKRVGVDKVRIERYPADGRQKYWTYTSVMGWNVRSAELRLLEPREKLLAKFSEIPQSLHTFSKGTPRNGVTAELIDVGKGVSDEDYSGKDVKGRVVLATGLAKSVHNAAVTKRGAAGVLTDTLSYEFLGVRESADIPDAHSYQGIWPDARAARKTRFGFSLSRRQGNELRRYIESGKTVKLHAKVDADLTPGKYSIVSATIPGSERPEEEIFLVAHLCHPRPSANDNASGSGLLIEIARTITKLIGSGRIERPKRTIRFLWVPETVGTVVFLSKHPELHERLVAGVNLDMVGEDQEQCRSTLCMDCTPDSLPSYLNDLVYSMVERANAEYDNMAKLGMVSDFRYARTPFSGGSDHAEFNEASVGAPCVGLTQWPDLFYHTSMDTIDKVSEDSLRRVGLAAATSVLTLADADTDVIHELSSLTASEGMKRISHAVGEAAKKLFSLKSKPAEARRAVDFHTMRLKHIITREEEAVRSVARLDDMVGDDGFVESQIASVREHGSNELSRLSEIISGSLSGGSRSRSRKKAGSRAGSRARAIVPKRRFRGTIDTDLILDELGEEDYGWYRRMGEKDSLFSKKMYEIVNLMDGKRDLSEITDFVSAEYGHTDHRDVLRFVEDLKRIRLVSYRSD